MTDFGGAIRQSKKYDLAILGVPFDEKSSYLKGPAKGPQAIRDASTSRSLNSWTELGVNLEEATVMVDSGDISVSGDFLKVFSRIEEKVFEVLEDGAVPIVLGGDHSITYPVIKAFARKFQHLDILHFDAHPDLYAELYGDRYSHACPFTRIVEEGLVQNLVQVGIRTAIGEHRKRALDHRIRLIEMKDIKDLPILNFSNPLYISFDMDVLDPAYAPGVSHHEPGGLSTRQVVNMIHSLKSEIVGLDVVELNPERDISEITAAASVKVIKEVAGKIVLQKNPGKKETR
ncbi:agmatinase [Acidobacteriota bacterium]